MLSLKDRKVAALLLNKGQLSREQLNECVGIQQRLEEPRSLASILVARRYITADRLKTVMNDAIKAQHVAKTNAYKRSAVAAAPGAARAPAPSAAPEKGNWETDIEIGRLLVARRVITEQQARECLGLLQKLLPSRPNARLTQVILKRRYTSRDALRMILSEYEDIKARNEAAPSSNNGNGHGQNGNGYSNGAQRNGHANGSNGNGQNHGFFNSSNGSGIAPPPMAPPPPPPPAPVAGLGAPPPLAADPFASVKPKPRQDFDADQSAPFTFGSAEAPRATNPMFGSGLDAPMNPADADKTMAPSGNFPGIQPVHESQFTSGSGAFPGFSPDAQAGPNISNVPPPIQQPSFNLPDLPRNPSGPIPIIAPIPPMMGSGVAPAPMMGSGAMPPMMGSGVAPAPMMGSGAMPPMMGSGAMPSPLAPPPVGGPSPFASGAPNSQMPQLMDDRMGFKTMDLDGGNSAPPPMMGSGAMPPMGNPSNPMNPMASGPLMAPVSPNVMGSGPMPGPMASGPMGNPMASGPMPGPMGSGMGFGAPSASQAPSPEGFKTFDLKPAASAAPSPFGSVAAPAKSKPKPKPRISDKTAPDRSRSKTNTRSQKSRSRPSQSRSRAAERRSRADGDGDKSKKKKALLSSEMLLIAASVLVLALIGGGAYSYFNRVRSVKTLRNDLKIALAEDNVEEAFRIVNELVEYEGETPEYNTQIDSLGAKVEERKKRRDSNALIDQAGKESDPVKALELCQQAADLDPDYAKAHVALGEYHLKVAHFRRREGKIEEYSRLLSRAKSSLEEAMKIDGSNQMAYFLLAEIQTLLNATYPELKANYNRSFMCDKNSWLGMLANARLRELEGREDLAIKNYDNALRKKRNIKEALIARAELYRRKRNYTKALTDIDRILNSVKNDPDALVLRAHIRLDQGDNDGTTDDLKKVAALDKGNAMALGLSAHLKLLKDDRPGALEDCNAALKIDRNCYYPYRVRGEIRLTAKDADRIGAEGDFRTAVRFAPLISDNHYWYGRLLQENDDKEGALRAYTKCLDLDKKNWRAYCNRGTVRRLLHDYDNALRDVDQAVVLQPKNGQVLLQRSKIRWVRLRKGGIDYKESQWNDVMSDLNEAIRQQPNLSDAYGRRGFIHRRRKKFKESLADYDRAIKLEPEDVYVWYGYRGLLYAEYNENRKAVEDFGQYLKSAASTHQIYSRVQKERSRVRRELDKNE